MLFVNLMQVHENAYVSGEHHCFHAKSNPTGLLQTFLHFDNSCTLLQYVEWDYQNRDVLSIHMIVILQVNQWRQVVNPISETWQFLLAGEWTSIGSLIIWSFMQASGVYLFWLSFFEQARTIVWCSMQGRKALLQTRQACINQHLCGVSFHLIVPSISRVSCCRMLAPFSSMRCWSFLILT